MRIRSFATRRWLAVVGISVLLGACSELPPCVGPGTGTPGSCYYKLTITDVDMKAGLVKGTVDKSVVEEASARPFSGFDKNEYTYVEYTFKVKDDTMPQLVKGQSFEFCSVPKTEYLELKQKSKSSECEKEK